MFGSARPTVTVLHGAEGFARLAGGGRFAVADPRLYDGSWRTMQVDGLQVSEWSTTPIAGSVLPSPNQPAAIVIAVLDGELDCRLGDQRATITVGQLCVLDATRRIRFATRLQTRLMRIVVPQAIVPARLRLVGGAICAAGSTRLSQSLTSLAELALEPTPEGVTSPACRAVRALTIALLEELVPTAPEPDPRAEIVAYIERSLADPELSPRTIAEAFGISVRWVHHLFNDEQVSIARFIRLRRLEVIAAELATDRRLPRINVLAERNGFTSRDGLTRAFKARYGMPIADYAELASQGRAPVPVGAAPDRTDQQG